MPKRRYKPEEIVAKLRQVDVLVSQGASMADAIRQIAVSEVACATNFSMARYSTRCGKPRSSSRAGAGTTMPSGLMLLGYKPPAPEVFVPAFTAWPAALRRPAPPATLAQPPALN